MIENAEKPDMIFETSWEVCNKVGGIYTVLSTKAKTLQNDFKDKVIFIGPDIWSKDNPCPFFKESKTLLQEWRKQAVFPLGMEVRIGRWTIPGNPIVILVDYKALFTYKDELYAQMWNKFSVDSLHSYGDYDDSCMFAYAAALVIESIYLDYYNDGKSKVIAHFDEWTTGMGLLYLKSHMPSIATVFTTHATSIGRSICCNNKPLYDYLAGYNGDQMAGELNMQSKHSLEKAAAWNADSFTTVSEVTARECVQLLGRKPLVTPNGFEQTFVPSKKEYPSKRAAARGKMLEVARSLTGIDLNDSDTFIVATAGRNEFRNKGYDVFIDAMNNIRNTQRSDNKKVLAFMFVPAWVDEPRRDLAAAMQAGKCERLENPVITHTLHNYSQDAIYGKINYLGMHYSCDNNFVVIYVPSYLNGTDGIFDMPYYDLLPGLDCTVFASYYEPWGYTPLESVAFGVPTITTDLAGFGQWILDSFENGFTSCGVKVLHRNDSNYNDVVANIADNVLSLISQDSKSIEKMRTAASATSKQAQWKQFMKFYYKSYEEALQYMVDHSKEM